MNGPGRARPNVRRIAALAVLVLLGATACGALALAQATAPAKPRAANQPNGGRNGARNYVPADSGPSAEALKVLDSIAEPLSPSGRVPAPAVAGVAAVAAADSARGPAADSLGAKADSMAAAVDDSASSAAPVPAPTQPLGDTSRTVPGYSEPEAGATGAGAAAAGGAGTAPVTSSAAAASTVPDTCWSVQIASPTEKERAESLRDAAESLLMVRMTIEPSKGRFGVRTSDCLTGATADSLRRRALATGFKDAFRVKWVRKGSGR